MPDLYGYSLLTIFVVGLAAILGASELGWRDLVLVAAAGPVAIFPTLER
jgi:hypothetical protein